METGKVMFEQVIKYSITVSLQCCKTGKKLEKLKNKWKA